MKLPERGTVKVKCVSCDANFDKPAYAIRRRPEGAHCCSNECRWIYQKRAIAGKKHPRWAGGYSYRSGQSPWAGNWDRIRKAIRKRDGFKCRRCGKAAKRLEVHHLKPIRLFDTPREANNPRNLLTLCVKCHAEEHRVNA